MRREHHAEIDSTTTEARRRVMESDTPREAFVVSADVQTCGLGRRGRAWSSPKGGVWLTAAWPTAHAGERWELISLAAASVAHRVVAEWLVDQERDDLAPGLRVKWPNDVLLGAGKLAGILCERVETPKGAWVLTGVGVNVDLDAGELGDVGRPVATLRSAVGEAVDHAAIADRIVEDLGGTFERFENGRVGPELVVLIDAVLAWRGERVELGAERGETVTGVLLGLDWVGGVRIETSEGERAFASGELRRLDG